MKTPTGPSLYPVLDNRPIDQWKVTELKEELKKRKLITKGLKEDLIKRLDEAIRTENESDNIEKGFAGIPQPALENKDDETIPVVSETSDMMDDGSDRNHLDGEMDQPLVEDIALSLAEGKAQDGEVTGGIDSAKDVEMNQSNNNNEVDDEMDQPLVHDTAASLGEGNAQDIALSLAEGKAQDGEVTCGIDSAKDVEMNQSNNNNEVDDEMDQPLVHDTAASLGEGNAQDGEVTGGIDSARDVEMDRNNNRNEVDSGIDQVRVYDTAESLGEGKAQDMEVKCGTYLTRDEEMVVHATSVETSIMINESVAAEIAVNVQESQVNESDNEKGNLIAQLESEDIKPLHEDIDFHSSDLNNQVSEVNTVLGFQEKSDFISSDCVSTNEKNELKDNIIADNVKLELDVKHEVQLSSSDVLLDGDKLHPVDVEEPQENKVPVEERDDFKVANAEMSEKSETADVVSSEKLNLDRISGDDSMEDDALESKHVDSKYNSNEVGDRSEKPEVLLMKEDIHVDIIQDDVPEVKKNRLDENKIASAAPTSTVKRKLHDQEVIGNNEAFKRQRRWNTEKLKVEPPINHASSTTPKDAFPSTALKRNFSRSDSTVSEDAPKERIVPPSPKPPSNSLRIDRFLRPFTNKAVHELLGKTGTVTSFWMDQIKTHCYVTYSSVDEAMETRNALYNLQWPPNGGRLLVVEFVDPQEVKMRVDAPLPSPSTPVSTGPIIPPAPPTVQPQAASRQQVPRQQLPPPPALPPPPPLSNPPPVRERLQLPPPPPPPPEKVEAPTLTLDDLFKKTKATPRIYYLPLSDEQVARKLVAQGKSIKQSAGVACWKELFQAVGYRRAKFLLGLMLFKRLLCVVEADL